MAPEKKQLSKVVPVLIAALVCDIAAADPSTGKKNLIGIFDRLNVGSFPTGRPMSVYIKVTDAEGDYELELKFVQVSTGRVIAGAEGALHSNNRLASVDMLVHFPPLPIPEAGRYEFQIWANNMFLGSAFLDAVPQEKKVGS